MSCQRAKFFTPACSVLTFFSLRFCLCSIIMICLVWRSMLSYFLSLQITLIYHHQHLTFCTAWHLFFLLCFLCRLTSVRWEWIRGKWTFLPENTVMILKERRSLSFCRIVINALLHYLHSYLCCKIVFHFECWWLADMLPGLLEGQEKMSKSDPLSSIYMEDEEVFSCIPFLS